MHIGIPHQYLKKNGRISFNEAETESIKTQAKKAIRKQGHTEAGELLLRQAMKKIGVIEFFKQLEAQGKETVFDVERKETPTA